MKRRLLMLFTTLLVCSMFVFAFSACGEKHKHKHVETITMPTCTEQGYTTHTCECGDTYVDSYTDKLGHDEVSHEAQEPSCVEVGWEAYETCSRCNYTTYVEIPALKHNTVQHQAQEPTCTEIGWDEYETCSRCDYTTYVEIPALNHDIQTHDAKAETCTEIGWEAYETCSRCDYTTYKEIPALNHDIQTHDAKAVTCTEIGWEAYETCTRCDYTTYVEISAPGHNYSEQKTEEKYLNSEASCTNKATYFKSCKCGEKGTTTFEYGELGGHTEVIDEEVPATFGKTGLTQGKHCQICEVVLVEQVVIPALGSNTVASTDYLDKKDGITYRYSYSLALGENNRFTLTTLTVGSDESYSIDYKSGYLEYVKNDVYQLVFDEPNEELYIKIHEGRFKFCKKDGSKWYKTEYREEDGVTLQKITPREGNSVYGYEDLANNTHGRSMQDLYYRLYSACEAFTNSNEDLTNLLIDTINLENYIITADEVVAVWKVFYTENPTYYWLSNTMVIEDNCLKLSIDSAYSLYNYRLECNQDIEQMVSAFKNTLTEGLSELETALAIHDFILNYMDYAYEDDGVIPQDDIWAHNIIGCAQYNFGVCESYAKTYLYLSLISDINCVIVTGEGNGEAHAWNIVQIDGIWYGVDCTWDETNVLGSIFYDCFGMASGYLDSAHIADSDEDYGIDYLYKLPKVSERSIELVTLYKNGEYVGKFANADFAFNAMIDATADYTIELFAYQLKGPLLLASPSIIHMVQSSYAPAVSSILIKGHNFDLGNGYSTDMPFNINDSLTINSDIVIEDITLGGGTLLLQDFCLTIQGSKCYVDADIIGNIAEGNSSKIIDNAGAEYCGEITVYELVTHLYGNTYIRNSSKIINLIGICRINGWGNSVIEIENWKEFRGCCFISCEANCKLIIDNLYILNDDLLSNAGLCISFSKYEDYPDIIIGNIRGGVFEITLDSDIDGIITDMNGDIVGRFEDHCAVFGLTRSIVTLGDKISLKDVIISTGSPSSFISLEKLYINDCGEVYFKEVTIVKGLIIIENTVVGFEHNKVKDVIIPDSVTSIGDSAFFGCDSLTSIKIPNSVTSIGDYAFYRCSSLTSIEIPNSVTSIGDCAFYGCRSLTSIEIPNSVTSIGDSAFYDCSSLTSYYQGTADEWNKVTKIGLHSYNFLNAIYYYSEKEPALNADGTQYDGNYWHYDTDGVTPVAWVYVKPEEQNLS